MISHWIKYDTDKARELPKIQLYLKNKIKYCFFLCCIYYTPHSSNPICVVTIKLNESPRFFALGFHFLTTRKSCFVFLLESFAYIHGNIRFVFNKNWLWASANCFLMESCYDNIKYMSIIEIRHASTRSGGEKAWQKHIWATMYTEINT